MAKRRIDRFLNEALQCFSDWLKNHPDWRGKEHDCVNFFAHNFLFPKIEKGAAIEHYTQVCIECALRQPKGYVNRSARKDLVIWEAPFQNTWSEDFEATRSPKAVMEWKVFRKRRPSPIFNSHDESWIAAYTKEEPDRFGYVVSLDLSSNEPKVYWRQAKNGVFGNPKGDSVEKMEVSRVQPLNAQVPVSGNPKGDSGENLIDAMLSSSQTVSIQTNQI